MKIPPNETFAQIGELMILLFATHLANLVTGMWFTRFGTIPRTAVGLRGILFSPLLHRDWSHLIANAAPLAGLLCIMAFTNRHALWPNTAAIWLISGAAVWLFGRPGSVQVGASGLIYGLAAFLIAMGWLHQDAKSALAALLVIFLYGGIVWGLLPSRPGVSWEGHLCGALAGILVANLPHNGSFLLRWLSPTVQL
jgi:membrane associated rhomboid family serine protease